MSKIILEEQASAGTPSVGKVAIYPKTGGGVYKTNASGVEVQLTETGHSHDGRYYTETEVNTISGSLQDNIDSKSDTSHIHDDRYYTEDEVDLLLTAISGSTDKSFLDLTDTPTTYSGGIGRYLKTTASGIEFCDTFKSDCIVYVSKNGSDSTEDGGIDCPFLTIEAANNYAISLLNPVVDWNECIIVRVAPGVYTEQITSSHRRIFIIGEGKDFENWPKPVILYNTGADPDHYPIGCKEYLNMSEIQVQVDSGGVFGELVNRGLFSLCVFEGGSFIEQTTPVDLTTYYNFCGFWEGKGFDLSGTINNSRFIALRKCDFSGTDAKFGSSGTESKTIKFDRSMVGTDSTTISGNWSLLFYNSEKMDTKSKLIIDTGGFIDLFGSVITVGIHFLSDNAQSKTVINCIFKDTPVGERDITADVDILNVEYSGNHQDNGLAGEIKIDNTVKYVSSDFLDTYGNINEALKSASVGDLISLGSETYEVNIDVPEGINIIGVNNRNTILTSSSGTTITLSGSLSNTFDRLSICSTLDGTAEGSALKMFAGKHYFNDCVISSTVSGGYTNTLLVRDSTIVLKNSLIEYTGIGNTTGSCTHRLAYFDGTAGLDLRDSTVRMIIADENSLADASVLESTASGVAGTFIETYLLGNVIEFNAESPLWDGNCYGYRAIGNGTNRNVLTNTIKLQGSGLGNAYWYVLDTPNNAGEIHSSSNRIRVIGFSNNYFGDISAGDTLFSHFDDITASEGVIGDGVYEFVNSPDPGDIRISGAYINMYDNDIIVAKRGGEFTSLKAAMESITDNSSTNRYNIHVHSGFYTEDNPIQLKPYVYIIGQFKHNPRIIPANSLEHLFTVASGYCTCDLGELTLQAPAGDNSHQVYMVYAGAGCKPIMGIYQCLFLGDNINYCNGFRCEEPLSGFHMVNCMTYGSFNIFAHMSGGNWTDSGFIPEATTAVNHYLYMDGEGIAIIDLMRAKCHNFENMFYINHADAELIVSDIYSEDQQTLITGPNGGKIRMRGSTFHGKNSFDAGDITIHGGTFEDNAYIESLTGNLGSLSITSTKNKNENTHCINVTGGGSTEIYFGGGNIFDSPNGTESIKLTGTFANVQVEGVRQYNLACLASGISHTFEHLPDLDYSRLVQVQAYPGVAGSDCVKYLTADESNYIQEDDTKTVFVGDTVTLSGSGSVAYGHWHLNDGTGSTAVDSSGNGRDGTLYNMEPVDWSSSSKLGAYCLSFNSSNEHVRCGNIANFNNDDVFSLEFWYNTSNTASQYVVSKMSYMLGVWPNPSYYRGYGAYLSGHRMNFMLTSNSTNNLIHVYTSDQSTSGAWHHCIVTYDGSATASGVNIWVDGQNKTLAGVADSLTGVTTNNANFQISGRNRTEVVWVGSLDEVAVYEQKLTPIEISYRYNSGTGTESLMGTYPTIEGYYITTASGSSINISTWTNIGGMVFDETIKGNTQIRYLLSVDDRNSWNYWGGSAWVAGTLSGIDTCGTSSDVLESLIDTDFDGLFTTSSGTLDIAAGLKTTSAHLTPILDNIFVNYSTPGSRDRLGDSNMKVTYVDTTHTKITNMTDKPITGIKCNILKMKPY